MRGSLPVHHVAAINIDGLAGDVLTLFGGEEDGHGGDVLGLLAAIERHELLDLVGRPFLVRLALGYGLLLVPGFQTERLSGVLTMPGHSELTRTP